MARTVVGSAVVVRQKYYWPDAILNIWWIVMLATAGTILGISAQFMMIQNQMRLGMPWIMPYGLAVGILALLFIGIMMVLISQRRLLPGIMMLFSFVLLVLFITGIVGTALQLFAGPNVNNLCNRFVGNMRQFGPGVNTLAWLQQQNICEFLSHFILVSCVKELQIIYMRVWSWS